jgi:site-specific recombinase XerD
MIVSRMCFEEEDVELDVALATVEFLSDRRRANCQTSTMNLYTRQLTTWQEWLRANNRPAMLPDLGIGELRGFFDALSDRRPRLADNTIASYYRTLRAFWNFLAREELLSGDQQRFFARMTAPSIPDDPRPVTDASVVKRLLDAIGDADDEERSRNRAIVLLLSESGMRISELCNLTDAVVDHRNRRARLLRAKGGKHRMAFWQPSAAAALARYLLLRRGKHGGPLFRGCSSRNNGGAITPDLVRSALGRIAKEHGIKLPKGAPLHSIRHGFAHAALENGAQLTDLADLLGHADLETTRIYLRNDDDRLARAYERIFRPRAQRDSERQDRERHG